MIGTLLGNFNLRNETSIVRRRIKETTPLNLPMKRRLPKHSKPSYRGFKIP
jgi:hypothetical protein